MASSAAPSPENRICLASCQLGGVTNLGSRADLGLGGEGSHTWAARIFLSSKGALEGEASLTDSPSWLGRDVPARVWRTGHPQMPAPHRCFWLWGQLALLLPNPCWLKGSEGFPFTALWLIASSRTDVIILGPSEGALQFFSLLPWALPAGPRGLDCCRQDRPRASARGHRLGGPARGAGRCSLGPQGLPATAPLPAYPSKRAARCLRVCSQCGPPLGVGGLGGCHVQPGVLLLIFLDGPSTVPLGSAVKGPLSSVPNVSVVMFSAPLVIAQSLPLFARVSYSECVWT